MSDQPDKRRFARTEVHAAVQYRLAGNETAWEGWLGNLSVGGILLWTELTIEIGTILYLRIRADELGEDEVEVTATVVRTEPDKQGDRFGYGCRFDAIYSGPHVD